MYRIVGVLMTGKNNRKLTKSFHLPGNLTFRFPQDSTKWNMSISVIDSLTQTPSITL